MTAYVFTGPTISASEAALELEACFFPPAGQGDVYRAALARPTAIGIIDGVFERIPAVWHKEILWAMSQGVHVFGSASIGALRAAELAPFGMVGVGRIFEDFRDGVLEDDDEVTLVHGPAEAGFRALSEPMVNIRATLREAERVAVIASATARELERLAKHLFYPHRTYPAVLTAGTFEGLPSNELERLKEWLPSGSRNQKLEDAIAMLRAMRTFLAADPAPKQIPYAFEYTETWDHVRQYGGEFSPSVTIEAEVQTLLPSELLEELRLEAGGYLRARARAMTRSLAVEEAHRRGLKMSQEALDTAIERFRRERRLEQAEDVQAWLIDNGLASEAFVQLLEEEALCNWVHAVSEGHIAGQLIEVLRLSGDYPRLRKRAQLKKEFLKLHDLENAVPADFGLTYEALLQWYFERARQDVPENVDQFAASLGLNLASFRRSLLREFCYATSTT